jgi:hypothetical protein
LYRCEEARKFERVASIIGAYRLALARWEQAQGNDALDRDEVERRRQALKSAEGVLAVLATIRHELTPASRQLLVLFMQEMQRRGELSFSSLKKPHFKSLY